MVDIQRTVDLNRIKRTVEVRALFNLVIVPPSGVYEQASISWSRNGTQTNCFLIRTERSSGSCSLLPLRIPVKLFIPNKIDK